MPKSPPDKARFYLSISKSASLLVGTLMLIVVCAVALPLATDLRSRTEAREAILNTEINLLVLEALQITRAERTMTMEDLQSRDIVQSSQSSDDLYRKQANALAAVVDRCHAFRCISDTGVVARIEELSRQQAQIHGEVRLSLRLPAAERNADLGERFNEGEAELISRLETLNISLGSSFHGSDFDAAALIEIKELAWLARANYLTAQAEIVLAAVEGRKSVERDNALHGFLGQADGSWAVIKASLMQPGAPSALRPIGAAADREIKAFRALCLEIHDDFEAGRPLRISMTDLSAQSREPLKALSQMVTKTTELAHAASVTEWAAINRASALRLCVILVACMLSVAGLIALRRRLILPMQAVTRAMTTLAAGNDQLAIAGATRPDELGALARAYEVFRTGLVRQKALERESLAIEDRLMREKRQALVEVGRSFEATISNLVATLSVAAGKIQATAGDMSRTAEQSRERCGLVMTVATSAAGNVAAASDASRILAVSTEQVGTHIEQTSAIVAQAVMDTKRSRDTIEVLVSESAAIGSVVTLINEVASRTNLLALNATIEAARAGEAGRGFTVVAHEVKALADQTIQATERIRDRIRAMQQASESAAQAINSVSTVINDVHGIARAIAFAAEEQRIATHNIASEMADAARGTSVLTGETSQARETAGIVGQTAATMMHSAAELTDCSARLDSEARRFLDVLNAA